MKIKRNLTIAGLWLLASTSLLQGQDLSKYRTFSLGASVAQVSKLADEKTVDIRVINKNPALVQELAWWPSTPVGSSRLGGSVQKILFSFYNDKLYRMLITYDDAATKGLTAEDMAQGLSAQYGTASPSTQELNFPTQTYPTVENAIDRWEDANDSVFLFQSSLEKGFGLLIFAKQMDAQASTAIAEAAAQAQKQAAQTDADRLKKESDDLEIARQKNLKTFQP